MERTKAIARELFSGKDAKLSHGKNKAVLTVAKADAILKDKAHYSKKLWEAEIEKLGIMGVCEQRPHKAVVEYGKMKGLIDGKAQNKMLADTLQLETTAKDYRKPVQLKKVGAKKAVASKKIAKPAVSTEQVVA